MSDITVRPEPAFRAVSVAAANQWLEGAGHPERVATADAARVMSQINAEQRSVSEQTKIDFLIYYDKAIKALLDRSTRCLVADSEYAEVREGYFSAFDFAATVLSEFLIKNKGGLVLRHLAGYRNADPKRGDLKGILGLFVSLTGQAIHWTSKVRPDIDLSFLSDEESRFENVSGDLSKIWELFRKFMELLRHNTLWIITELVDLPLDVESSTDAIQYILALPSLREHFAVPIVGVFTTLPSEAPGFMGDIPHTQVPIGRMDWKNTIVLADVHERWHEAVEKGDKSSKT